MVKVELSTLAYGAQRTPTSEKRLHRDLFSARADAGAAIHTHAKLCVFAAARDDLLHLRRDAESRR
ncbi:MAG: class II aldolase/adducin family protein [Eubacteriales bacterium]